MIESSSAGGTNGGAIISDPPPLTADDVSDSAEAALDALGGGAIESGGEFDSCFFGGGISAPDGVAGVALLLVRVVATAPAVAAAAEAACLTFAAAED